MCTKDLLNYLINVSVTAQELITTNVIRLMNWGCGFALVQPGPYRLICIHALCVICWLCEELDVRVTEK